MKQKNILKKISTRFSIKAEDRSMSNAFNARVCACVYETVRNIISRLNGEVHDLANNMEEFYTKKK